MLTEMSEISSEDHLRKRLEKVVEQHKHNVIDAPPHDKQFHEEQEESSEDQRERFGDERGIEVAVSVQEVIQDDPCCKDRFSHAGLRVIKEVTESELLVVQASEDAPGTSAPKKSEKEIVPK